MFVWQPIKNLLFRLVPAHIDDPIGLVKRILRSNSSAARFTLLITGLSVLFTPIDWLFARFQKKPLTHSPSNDQRATGPHIIVCGPARSGTTLVYQLLSRHLDVAYTRNIGMLFPTSSTTGIKLSEWLYQRIGKKGFKKDVAAYENYYGKTSGFFSASEANFLWNQWVEPDQSHFRTIVTEDGVNKMAGYYRQLSAITGSATLAKNNNANVFASRLAELPDDLYFICLRRDSRYLAQSLIKARLEINGDIEQSYGVVDTTSGNPDTDPYKQVLDQISYLDVQADEQQAQLGPDRFWIVNYEDFCKDPSALVNSIRKRILGVEPLAHPLPPITSNNKVTDEKVFSRICELIKTDVVTGKSTAKDEFATASGDTPSEKPRENLPATSDNTRAASSNKTQPA